MKIFFYGTDRVEPDVMKDVFSVFYEWVSKTSEPPLVPGLPVIYIAVKDVDGDIVFLTDKDNPDLEVSWEVRTTPRQSEKSGKDLLFKDEVKHIYIYQHLESRNKGRFS